MLDTNDIPPQLLAQIASQCSRPVAPETALPAAAIRERFGPALDAIILYGSCLRDVPVADGVVDFYALVSDYRAAYPEQGLRLLNRVLPPNVFYAEVRTEAGPVRAKYAVISMKDFEEGNRCWFHSYLWARFAQPVRILQARGEAARAAVHEALAHAVLSFLKNVIPAIEHAEFEAETLWGAGLALTYAAELRPERDAQARELVQRDRDDYERLTQAALPALHSLVEALPDGRLRRVADGAGIGHARRMWKLRRLQGRVLSILRLMKAALTFSGGIDYAAWKVERHSGIHIEVTPGMRRRPILGGLRILWKLLRSGALR